jgi:hypothetical protein
MQSEPKYQMKNFRCQTSNSYRTAPPVSRKLSSAAEAAGLGALRHVQLRFCDKKESLSGT